MLTWSPEGRTQRIERVFAAVPQQGPPLAGRQEVFAGVRDRLAEGGALALHGLPGAGKSALALALAYDPVILERFTGGELWAGLGPWADVDGGVLALWATALGVDVAAESTTAAQARRLNAHLQSTAALAAKPFLLVLA